MPQKKTFYRLSLEKSIHQWYDYCMENKLKRTYTTVSMINYHFVFCPRYRRKIFQIEGVEERFKELTAEFCSSIGVDILAMECHIDHVHLFVQGLPKISPSDLIHQIKGATSFKLRQEFPQLSQMPSLWTRSYFVSTAGNVSSKTIEMYINSQKTRG